MTTMNTLQNLCLNEIIPEFSSHYKAYCDSEDSSSKLKFEFLKKKFSFVILQKLNEEHKLKTEYLDFLINKYLKVLDTQWLKEWPWETISQKLVEIGTNFEEVTFDDDRPWAEILCYLPNLKKVLFQCYCSDEFLLHLSTFCGSIETLDITSSLGVSDSGLVNLCCIHGKNTSYSHLPIHTLLISNTRVEYEGVAYVLKNNPNIRCIDYWLISEVLYSMHKSDINALDKVKPYNLIHLDLMLMSWRDIYNDMLTVCVSVCPHLKSLSCPILEKSHLDLCSQLQELQKLQLYCMEKLPLELNELLILNGKMLTSLKISNFSISLLVLASNCPYLNLLQLGKVNLQHNVNDCVPVFHHLEKVVFKNFNLMEPVNSQAVTCLLSSAPNLNHLSFEHCELFTSDIKTQILRCCEQCKLTIIRFTESKVELALVRDILLTCSTLKTLYLRCDIARDYEARNELEAIATSLPNKPQFIYNL